MEAGRNAQPGVIDVVPETAVPELGWSDCFPQTSFRNEVCVCMYGWVGPRCPGLTPTNPYGTPPSPHLVAVAWPQDVCRRRPYQALRSVRVAAAPLCARRAVCCCALCN